MTLDEMKLAVCEKLPKLIVTHNYGGYGSVFWNKHSAISCPEINWPTEGLQVCHEAEKLLFDEDKTGNLWIEYIVRLQHIVGKTLTNAQRLKGRSYHSTYEQRLEALCRVWFPERFI